MMVKHRLKLQYEMAQFSTIGLTMIKNRERSTTQRRNKKNDEVRGADLSSSEFFFVFFPLRFETIAGLGSIAGVLFSSLVSSVFFRCLVWKAVSKPICILLQCSWKLEGTRIRWGSS